MSNLSIYNYTTDVQLFFYMPKTVRFFYELEQRFLFSIPVEEPHFPNMILRKFEGVYRLMGDLFLTFRWLF